MKKVVSLFYLVYKCSALLLYRYTVIGGVTLMNKFRVYRGFTLIELMVVIAIISILILITLYNVAKARADAKLSTCVANLKTIAAAIEMAQIDHPEWFKGKQNVVYVINKNDKLVVNQYLKAIPKCPNGAEYSYKIGNSIENVHYNDYWHVAHQTKNNHYLCGIKDYYPYYRCDRGICYDDEDLK